MPHLRYVSVFHSYNVPQYTRCNSTELLFVKLFSFFFSIHIRDTCNRELLHIQYNPCIHYKENLSDTTYACFFYKVQLLSSSKTTKWSVSTTSRIASIAFLFALSVTLNANFLTLQDVWEHYKYACDFREQFSWCLTCGLFIQGRKNWIFIEK